MTPLNQRFVTLLLILSLLLGVTATVGAQEADELSRLEALLQSIRGVVNDLAKQVVNIAPASQTAAVGTSNLVAYYSFDEGSGGTLNDTSGNNNDGTINGASWSNGVNGFALQFDGVDDFVETPHSSSLQLTNVPITISAWIKRSTPITVWNKRDHIVHKSAGSNYNYSFYLTLLSSETFTFIAGGGGDYKRTLTNVSDNSWHHVASVFDPVADKTRLYVDGALVADVTDTTSSFNTGSGSLYIGSSNNFSFFNGSLDEIRIYNKALSESEILDLYNNPGQGGGSTPAPTPDPTPSPSDTTPPTISNGSPTGTLGAGTTNTTLRVTTNENAICKWSTNSSASYFSMNSYASTGGTTHSANLINLQAGRSYTYYTKCQDTPAGNTSSNYTVSFSVPQTVTTPVPDPGPAPAIGTIPGVRPAPSWVNTLPVGEFKAISKNFIKDVAASADPVFADVSPFGLNGAPWSACEGISGITGNWNGGALASNYGEAGALLVWGGGHCGYGGSDVYGFDLADLEWKRLSNPYGSIPGGQGVGAVVNDDGRFPDGSPIPFHTGDGVDYFPEINSFVIAGSVEDVFGVDPPDISFHLLNLDHLTADNYQHTLTSSQWKFSGRVNDSTYPLYPGTCYDRSRKLLWLLQSPSRLDPSTRTGWDNLFFSYDPRGQNADGTVGTITSHDFGPGNGFNTMEASCDPKRDLFVFTNFVFNDPDAVYTKDLANPTNVEIQVSRNSGPRPTGMWKQHAFDYSDVRDSHIYYDDSSLREVWELKLSDTPDSSGQYTGTWNQISTGQGAIPDFVTSDVFSRFRIAKFDLDGKLVEVAVMVNNVGEQPGKGDVWAFRIPGEGDVVNTTPYVPGQNPTTPTPAPTPTDTTPPTVSGGSPDGTLPIGTTNTVMRVTTNEAATCRYSTNSGTNYNSMTPYDTTGGTQHSVTVTSLQNGNSYSYYTKCRDNASNVSGDYPVSFSVLAPVPTPSPTPTPNPTVIPSLDLTFDEKCEQDGVIICHRFTNDFDPLAEPRTNDLYYINPGYAKAFGLNVRPEYDPVENALKFTIPSESGANNSGTITFNHSTIRKGDQGNDQYWMQYKVKTEQALLDQNIIDETSPKYFVAYHIASCSGDAFVQVNGYWRGHPGYYETCGANGYEVANPSGQNNPSQFDFQPGGDSSCLYRNEIIPGKPCFKYKGDIWTTYTSHLDFANGVARVWAQNEGEEAVQIIEYPIQTTQAISSVYYGPYMTYKDATKVHPNYHMWYQDVIISNRPIDIGADIVATGPPVVVPTPDPTPQGKFDRTDNVKINISGTLNVRSTANGTILGTQTNGRVGTVIGGPTESGGNTWYQVNFTEGVDGWVSEDFIEDYSGTLPSPPPMPAPTPNPTPQPSPTPTPTPGGGGSTPPPTSGGGGGTPSSGGSTNTGGTVGGGGTITPTTGGGNIQRYEFTRNLRIGSRGDDVKELQKFLNNRGYTISTTGVGSRGNESSYFGQKTAEALKKFQNDHKAEVLTPNNLTRGNGYFGASTRSKVNELYTTIASTNGGVINTDIDTTGQTNAELEALVAQLLEQVAQLTAQLNARSGGTTVTSPTTKFTRTLRLGSRGEDVRRLQIFLNSDPDTQISGSTGGSSGKETAYFGKKTEDALKRYQAKHGIVSSGTPSTTGYGVLGPRTRARVNQ